MPNYTLQVFKGSSEGRIIQSEVRRTLADDEVLVRITHAGLCGTDLHFKNQDMVLGHEGVGVVQEVGSAVKSFKLGNEYNERKVYIESSRDQGGFGSHAIWKAAFLFHIPNAIPSAHAAPLMCAGTTVFNAMEMHGLRPMERVGILGLGGLGHLTIQFAAKIGCEVAVFSGAPGKEAEAKALGATEFHVTQLEGEDALKSVKPVDHLWEKFSTVLAARVMIYPMTVSHDNFSVPYMPSLMKGLRIQWTMVSSRALHNKMLHFVTQHHVEPIVQEFPLTADWIEEAMKKLADAVGYKTQRPESTLGPFLVVQTEKLRVT